MTNMEQLKKNTGHDTDGARGYSQFHQKLENIIKENWGISPQFTNPFAWGYGSTGIYLKSKDQKEYVAMLCNDSVQKRKLVEKNILISSFLNLSVKTPRYLKNKNGEYILKIKKIEVPEGKNVENKILILGNFLSGVLPFDMNSDILSQAIKVLEEIHQIDPTKIKHLLGKIDCEDPKFLHGDLTPSNMLVSYGKISGILDFELASLGPVEYDLARLGVFSWFRLKNTGFGEIIKLIHETYSQRLSLEKLKNFSYLHCQMHLDNVKEHEKIYDNPLKFREELAFAEDKLKNLKADLEQISVLI